MKKKNLYKIMVDYGRKGTVEGMFLATEKEVDSLVGKKVYFGNILGKHSDVEINIKDGDIILLTDNHLYLKQAKNLGIDLNVGCNPLNYIDE